MSATPDTAPAQQRVAVSGAGGRMGQMLIEAVLGSDDCALSGALDLATSPVLGADAAAFAGRRCGVTITADLLGGRHLHGEADA